MSFYKLYKTIYTLLVNKHISQSKTNIPTTTNCEIKKFYLIFMLYLEINFIKKEKLYLIMLFVNIFYLYTSIYYIIKKFR